MRSADKVFQLEFAAACNCISTCRNRLPPVLQGVWAFRFHDADAAFQLQKHISAHLAKVVCIVQQIPPGQIPPENTQQHPRPDAITQLGNAADKSAKGMQSLGTPLEALGNARGSVSTACGLQSHSDTWLGPHNAAYAANSAAQTCHAQQTLMRALLDPTFASERHDVHASTGAAVITYHSHSSRNYTAPALGSKTSHHECEQSVTCRFGGSDGGRLGHS